MTDTEHRTYSTPNHFYSLDALRGFAALSVVFWHWSHFYPGVQSSSLDTNDLPLFRLFSFFYTRGYLAVDLFFILSGFIFYWLYSKRVVDRDISVRTFAVLRFSRLYPLHFATLLFVAVAQHFYRNSYGSYFAYPNNDLKHFLLNVFFMSSWGMESGFSFNGPVWSVSIEVLLYTLFFVSCRLLPVRVLVLLAISVIGVILPSEHLGLIGRGIRSFFLGGIVFLVYQRIFVSHHLANATKWVFWLTIIIWIMTLFVLYNPAAISSGSMHLQERLGRALPWSLEKMANNWLTKVLFPLTVLLLSLMETYRGHLGKRLSFLGDISYSVYLLQFPLQILFMLAAAAFSISLSICRTPLFLLLFFVALISLSLASYHYFERPAQRFLRRKAITEHSSEGANT